MELARPDDFTIRYDGSADMISKFQEDPVGVAVRRCSDSECSSCANRISDLKTVAAWAYNLGFEKGAKDTHENS